MAVASNKAKICTWTYALFVFFFLFVCLNDQPPTYEIKKLNLAQLDNNKEHNIT